MSVLLRMYPGDECVLLLAGVLVQVTVIILAAWLLAGTGSRSSAAWRHSIYLIALGCALASPVLSTMTRASGVALVTLRQPEPPADATRIPGSGISQASVINTPAAPKPAEGSEHAEATSPRPSRRLDNSPRHSFSDFLRALGGGTLAVWLLGTALLVARCCHGLRVVAALRRETRPLDCRALGDVVGEVCRALGVEQLPPMATSAELDRPIMVGLLRPLVIVPDRVPRTMHGAKLADILIHEYAHAVCRHQVVGVLQRVAELLFWPHPLVHLLNRELSRAREEICDNYVLRRGDATRYARTLLELSQWLVGVTPKAGALSLFYFRWRLEDRIAGLLDPRRETMIGVNRWKAATVAASFLLLALLIAGTRVLQAEPAAQEKAGPGVRVALPADRPSTWKVDPAQDGELRQSARNLQEIMSAIHTYHAAAGHFPAARSGRGFDGKSQEWFRERPYLSWRVLLLPYLGELELFKKFRMDQPWDSEHNWKLIAPMPKVYRAPGCKAGDGKTNYLGSFGPKAAFPDKGTITVPEFTDGTSNTIMLIEVPDQAAVEWTRPEDFPGDVKDPVKKLVGLRQEGFLTIFADASPHFISEGIPSKTLQQLLVRNGGDLITPADWQQRWDRSVQPAAKDK